MKGTVVSCNRYCFLAVLACHLPTLIASNTNLPGVDLTQLASPPPLTTYSSPALIAQSTNSAAMLGSESTTASAKSVHVNSGVPGQLASFFSASFAQSSAASGNAVLNINFTSGGPEKFGFAAIGQSGADLWNTYQFPGQFFGELTDLVWSDGSPSQVAVQVANAPGGWGNGVDDEMYGSYIYPHNGGDVLVSLTNLPAGNYDFYIYGHGPSDDGNTIVELWSGASSFGQRGTTVCGSMWNSTEWEVGQQYVLYRNVSVAEGATVTIDVMPNAPGWAIINGCKLC